MARGRFVTCKECGKKINLAHGAWQNKKTKRYTCFSCHRKLNADKREQKRGMRQSIPAMLAKIIFGFLFVCYGLGFFENVEPYLPMAFIGLLLLAWGIIPVFRARKKRGNSYVK